MVIRISSLLCLLVLALGTVSAKGDCSSFVLDSDATLVYGRNMDYGYEHGLILVNKRGVSKTAFVPPQLGDIKPARWTSKYGSVTVSVLGREFPSSGMNEAGLSVSEMTLGESCYQEPDERGSVNVVQWIQYQLDSFSTVSEVLASEKTVRVFPLNRRGHHYLVCDASGDCAAIDFLEGQMVVHRREKLPVRALTNSTYESSQAFLIEHMGFGGAKPIPEGRSSLERFVRVANLLKQHKETDNPVRYAFRVLSDISQGRSTKWSLVFDIKARRLYFRSLSFPSVKFIDFSELDLSCSSPMKMFDMKQPGEGDVTDKLQTCTAETHGRFVRQVAEENREVRQLAGDPDIFVEKLNRYYGTFRCSQGAE